MPGPERTETATIIAIRRPSVDDLKRIIGNAQDKPDRWISFVWENPEGKTCYDAINPHQMFLNPTEKARKAILPKEGDENQIVNMEVIIHEFSKK